MDCSLSYFAHGTLAVSQIRKHVLRNAIFPARRAELPEHRDQIDRHCHMDDAPPARHPPTRMNTHGPAHTHSTLFQRWCQRSHTVSVSIVIERRTHSRGQREHGARETSRDAPCTLQITPTNESPNNSAGWSCAHAAARRRWPFGRLCEVGEGPPGGGSGSADWFRCVLFFAKKAVYQQPPAAPQTSPITLTEACCVSQACVESRSR